MEILIDAEIVPKQRLEDLMKEVDELVAIIVTSITTSKKTNSYKPKTFPVYFPSAIRIPNSAFQ